MNYEEYILTLRENGRYVFMREYEAIEDTGVVGIVRSDLRKTFNRGDLEYFSYTGFKNVPTRSILNVPSIVTDKDDNLHILMSELDFVPDDVTYSSISIGDLYDRVRVSKLLIEPTGDSMLLNSELLTKQAYYHRYFASTPDFTVGWYIMLKEQGYGFESIQVNPREDSYISKGIRIETACPNYLVDVELKQKLFNPKWKNLTSFKVKVSHTISNLSVYLCHKNFEKRLTCNSEGLYVYEGEPILANCTLMIKGIMETGQLIENIEVVDYDYSN